MTALPALIAVTLIAAQPAAEASRPACLAPAEFTALARFMLPALVENAAERCKAELPKSAYLIRESKGLARYYREQPKPDSALVDRAIVKLGLPEKLGLLADSDLGPVVQPALTELVMGRLQSGDCGLVSDVIEFVAPLPIDDLSLVVGLVAEIGDGSLGGGPIRLCSRDDR